MTVLSNTKNSLTGTRAGRIKAIFSLPDKIHGNSSHWSTDPLAYVEWYTKFSPSPPNDHKMYTLSVPPLRQDGTRPGKIIPLSQIRQSCQLIPHYDTYNTVPRHWTSENILDTCKIFWLNNWTSLYAYQTLW